MLLRRAQSRLLCIIEGNQVTMEKVHSPSTRLSNFILPGKEMVAIRPILQPQRVSSLCRRVSPAGRRRFQHWGCELIASVFAYLARSQVTSYNQGLLYETHHGWNTLWDMQYGAGSNSRHSMLNAASYGFYAGGKLLTLEQV